MRILHLFLPLFFVFSSCDVDGELAECPYNVKLDYWYTGSGRQNQLTASVFTLREYLFDGEGVLRQVNLRSVREGVAAKYQLQPGNYTLVCWGNIDSESEVAPAELGKTTLDEMQLYSESLSNTGKFYYGYCSFQADRSGVTKGRIDLSHAYLRLNVTMRWEAAAPANATDLRMTLDGHYPVYRFQPAINMRSSAIQDLYIPSRPDNCVAVRRSVVVKMDLARQVNGEFIGFRLHNDDHPVFCLMAGGKALIREIDLYRFFRTMQVELDRNIRQEFDLQVIVGKDGNVNVSMAYVGDWIDGGVLGEG